MGTAFTGGAAAATEEKANDLEPGLRVGALCLLGDDVLARMTAAGSQGAFAAIYERHHQGVHRYCRAILGSDDDAYDALQTTMMRALNGLRGEPRTIALRAWLYRIAHNEAISIIRRRPPVPSTSLDEEWGSVHETSQTLAHAFEARERWRQVVADLVGLPDRQRGALVMRELAGLRYAEIAEALGISRGAAKQAVYEARSALHQLSEGREMSCEDAVPMIVGGDGRKLRSRRLRSHLSECLECRDLAGVSAPT